MKNKILKNLGTLILGVGLSLNTFGQSLKMRESEVYSSIAERISFNDPELKNLSLSITKDCPVNDKECKANKIFNYVINNYKHIEHTAPGVLKSPEQTIKDGGGDCKDLSILYNSLLENIQIRTRLVFTKNHAYGLVCGVNAEKIEKEINISIEESACKNFSDFLNNFETIAYPKIKEPSYRIIDGETCISADPTMPYLGFIAVDTSEIRAVVDPLAKEMNF